MGNLIISVTRMHARMSCAHTGGGLLLWSAAALRLSRGVIAGLTLLKQVLRLVQIRNFREGGEYHQKAGQNPEEYSITLQGWTIVYICLS